MRRSCSARWTCSGTAGSVRQGRDRDARRGRRQGQRRDPGGRPRAAMPRARPHPARWHRVRPARWCRRPDRRRLHPTSSRPAWTPRPRGEHQDPARPGGRERRPHREAAQRLPGLDDRRGRRAGTARQLRAEPRAGQRRGAVPRADARARGLDPPAGAAAGPGAGGTAQPQGRRGPGSSARRGSPRRSCRCCWLTPRDIVLARRWIDTDIADDVPAHRPVRSSRAMLTATRDGVAPAARGDHP